MLCFVCLFVQPVHATAIVTIRTPTEIIVAADSKGLGRHGKVSATCKIKQINNAFYALSGLYYYKRTGFVLDDMVTEVLKGKGTILKKADRFVEVTQKPFIQALEEMEKVGSDYNRLISSGKPTIGIALFGIENKVLELHLRTIEVTIENGKATTKIVRKDCPGVSCSGLPVYLAFLGSQAANLIYAKVHPEMQHDLLSAARTLIEVEIQSNPGEVGPPIDILHISADGARWAQKKSECPEIQK